MFTPHHIAEICRGDLNGSTKHIIKYLVTDSRTISQYSETAFFALVSERNNGHKYIKELYNKGVRCFIVSENTERPGKDCAVIKVKNSLVALQQLSAHHRKQFQLPVLGITGSNGKTIVKEWLYQLLKHRFNICRSPKSYNSQIGVPLSVWNLNEHHNLGIFEAGISMKGEMKHLEKIITPSIGIFTGIGAAHREGFSSQDEKIKEKFILFKGCDTIVVNGLKKSQIPPVKGNKKVILISDKGDVAVKKVITKENSSEIEIAYAGKNYRLQIPFTDSASVSNALTCFGTLAALQLDLQEYIPLFMNLNPVALRLEIKNGINNCVLINDYYNSDLDSLQIALNYLHQQSRSSSKTVILSDIEQSGQTGKTLYKEIARLLEHYKIDRLIGIGKNISEYADLFKAERSFFENTAEFVKHFHSGQVHLLNSTILLKGGRRFGFEQISQILQQKSHDTVLEINLSHLTDNINYYRSLLQPGTQVMCMVKAMGYGSGSSEIARTLQHIGVNYLAVAYADEGVELRNAMIQLPIMVMSPEEDSLEDIINHNLEPEIYSFRVLEMFCRQLNKSGVSEPYPVHIKIDTGMKRLGFEEKDLEKLAQTLALFPQVIVQSVFSHLVGTDNPDLDDFTNEQIAKFEKACNTLEAALGYSFIKHICNSGGITRFKKAHYNMVRLGIGMYGVGIDADQQMKLKNVGSLKTKISQIKKVHAGETVGYNRNGKISKETLIATIPVGYADGFKRELGNGNFSVIINEKACKTIGNICMDMCMVDITGVNCEEGDEVIVFENFDHIQNMASALHTIPYEILTGISGRVKRIYVQE